MNKYDAIIVGAGFSGAVIAREIADTGRKVLIIEKRKQIGGNMYECFNGNGIRIHLYGPHIFHTNNEEIFNYLKKFAEFYEYEHKVIGQIKNKLVPIPFNYKSLEILFNEEEATDIKKKLKEYYPDVEKISILDLINCEDETIKKFGEYVYENVFANYTAKQWEIPVSKIDKSVINRVPVVLGYDDRYFNDKIQYMPKNGFTKLFENMLNNDNINIKLNTNIVDLITLKNDKIYLDGEEYSNPIIFTGAVDELLHYKYGRLPYRSLNLVFEDYDVDNFQENSVVNYPNDERYTRITEFKYLTKQKLAGKTTILKEYPLMYNEETAKTNDPYYPIQNEENILKYNKYKNDIEKYNNIYLVGRLAEYKYYNMDVAVERALEVAKKIMEDKKWKIK